MPARTRTLALTAALGITAALLAGPGPTATAAAAADCDTTLWAAGDGGYASYRIPAIVNDRGTLVAFAEARRNSGSDNGDIGIAQRRSTDGGCTWSPSVIVSDDWSNTVGNPVPMVRRDGGLVLVTNWQAHAATQEGIQDGTVSDADGRRIYVQTSTDAGAHWTARREITSSVKPAGWRWYATGPGHGTVIAHGLALGRLVVPADHTLTTRNERGMQTLLSDDGGVTWRLGAVDEHSDPDDPVRPDETTGAELLGGRMYFSSRNVDGAAQVPPVGRAYTYSLSSGSTVSAPSRPAPALVTPEVEGSLLQDPGQPSGVSCHPLLFSAPEDPLDRQHLTVRRSDDGGQTWRTVTTITGPTEPAAYSDITKVSRAYLGVLYETGVANPYERIDFQKVVVGCP